jgi:hypothetical protein
MSEDSGEPPRRYIPVCEVVKDPCSHGFFIGEGDQERKISLKNKEKWY